jgi:hypothetical protein
VTLIQAAAGGLFTGTFTLTAVGGPVSFTITVPQGLSVNPSTGLLTAGQGVTVIVTAIGNGPPTFTTLLTVSPGQTVTILYPPRG